MKMNSFNTNAHDFRSSKRICSSLTGCLIFVLLMSQTSCRPSETDSDNGSSEALTYNDKDYMDPDEIDWQSFAAVETTSKVHPIIFYKEDIVSEDYDPSKEKKKTTKQHHVKEIKPHHRRKYKEISRHHRHRNQTESFQYIKPEKVYFDINPIEHHVKEDASNEDDSSFNSDDIHVEVISLLNEDNNSNSNSNTNNNAQPADDEEEFDSKYLLSKKPKKVNHRYRRDVKEGAEDATSSVSLRHKRNPFYVGNSHYSNQLPYYRGVFFHPQLVIYPTKSSGYVKHPIKSPNYYNAYSPAGGNVVNRGQGSSKPIPDGVPTDFAQRFDDTDRPVWPIETNTNRRPATQAPPQRTVQPSRTPPPRRTPPPILQFGDEDYVTSSPVENRSSRPAASSASANSAVFSNPAPQTTRRPSARATSRPSASVTTSPPPASRGISACIWAISSCCTRNEEIRYQCFERLGCSGAFWDLNPCADEIFRLAVQAADQYLE